MMKRFFSSFFVLATLVSACAKPNPDIPSTEELQIYAASSITSPGYASCYVEFHDPDQANIPYFLESDSIVTCDGSQTYRSGNGYTANFPHSSASPVKISIIRPSAGTTMVQLVDPN